VVPRNQKEPNVYQAYTKSWFLVDGFQYVKEKVLVWAYVGMGIQVLDVFQYIKERALSKMLPGKAFWFFCLSTLSRQIPHSTSFRSE